MNDGVKTAVTGRKEGGRDDKAEQKLAKLKELRRFLPDVTAELSEMTVLSYMFVADVGTEATDDFMAHVVTNLPPGDFYYEHHRKLFEALVEAHYRHGTTEVAVVVDVLKKNGDFDGIGGLSAITNMAGNSLVGEALDIDYHIGKIRSAAVARKMQLEFIDGLHDLTMETETPEAVLFAAGKAVERITGELDRPVEVFGVPLSTSRWAEPAPVEKDWLVDGLIHRGTITMLDGKGGAGKSRLAMQLAIDVALGGSFLGTWECKPGKVLYLNAEDPDVESHRRFQEILKGMHIEDRREIDGILDRITCVSYDLTEEPPQLTQSRFGALQPSKQFAKLQRLCKRFPCDLIILDPLSYFSPESEETNTNATAFYSLLKTLKSTILISHHHNKASHNDPDGKMAQRSKVRGASALVELAKCHLTLEKGMLQCDKNNYQVRGRERFEVSLGLNDGLWRAVEDVRYDDPSKRKETSHDNGRRRPNGTL